MLVLRLHGVGLAIRGQRPEQRPAGFFYGYPGPYETAIVQWNGTRWTQVPSPNPDYNSSTEMGPGDAFTGLACTSTVCTAVGSESATDYVFIGGGPGTVIAARN